MICQNCTSPSFGKIKIDRFRMNKAQKEVCKLLSASLKSKKRYPDLVKEKNDIDICLLPTKYGIEVKFLNFYSGNYLTTKYGEPISIPIAETQRRFKMVTDLIIQLYDKIKNGEI